MPSKNWKLRIKHILESIEAIESYVKDMTFDEFADDRRTVDAVVRHFIIIGEAAGRVPAEICRAIPEVPWDDMRAMRNFVVHEYFGVSEDILWDTVAYDLPGVVAPLRRILDEQ